MTIVGKEFHYKGSALGLREDSEIYDIPLELDDDVVVDDYQPADRSVGIMQDFIYASVLMEGEPSFGALLDSDTVNEIFNPKSDV